MCRKGSCGYELEAFMLWSAQVGMQAEISVYKDERSGTWHGLRVMPIW